MGGMSKNGKLRALIIDDSSMMRGMVRGLLEALDLDVIGEAADAVSGVKAYETLRPDLVTLDIVMPGGTGQDVLKAVINIDPDAKVVIVSSVAQDSVRAELMAAGATAVLTKPLNREKFKAVLAEILAKAGKAAPEPVSVGAEERDSLLKHVLGVGAASSAQALTALCTAAWSPSGTLIHKGGALGRELSRLSSKGAVVGVRFSASGIIAVEGLFVASADSAKRMGELLTGGLGEGDLSQETCNEWANITITNLLNAVSGVLGRPLVSTAPEFVSLPLGELIGRALERSPGGAERAVAAQNLLSAEAVGIDCENWLIMPDAAAQRVAEAAKKLALSGRS